LDKTDSNGARLYASRIHNYFTTRFGRPSLLTLDDWTCIRKWREEGIPVEYVFHGIDRACLMKAGEVTSLAHCASAVREVWRYKLCS